MESICLTLVNCFPFFALKKVSLTNISNIQVYGFRLFKKELEKAERAANTVDVQHSEVNCF